MPRAAVVTVAVLTLLPHLVAEAFGVSNDIKIVGQSGGQSQKLPGSYVSGFTRWSVEGGNDISSSPSSRDDLSLVRLPTEGDDTFVNPTSTTELWWPMDLKSLQFRPSLDLLIQSGAPKYAFAGLNVRVPEHASADGGDWRNYGLSSQPLASQWTTFAFAVEGGFRVECFLGKSEDEDQKGEEIEKRAKNGGGSAAGRTVLWDRFFPGDLGALNDQPSAHAMFASEKTTKALETAAVFLSGIDSPSPLAKGFHVVSFPLVESWTDLPPLTSSEGYKILCVATAEPDAQAMVDADDALLEMSATSILSVDVLPTASGSDSQYLPESYRNLYGGQRPEGG